MVSGDSGMINEEKDVRFRLLFLALFAVMCFSALSFAQQSKVDKRFDQLDKNGDGKITPTELPAAELFKKLDLDGDSEITREEAAKAVAEGALRDVMKPANATLAPTGPTPMEAPVRQGPQPVRAGDHGVGRFVPDISFTDLTGATHELSGVAKDRIVVFAMTSTSCPLSKKYLPTLVDLVKTSEEGVGWVLVNPVATDKPADMQAAAERFDGKAIFVHDQEGQLASRLGALSTTDVIVLDASRTIVYHGAIDDQYGFGYSIEAPRYHYLKDALAAIQMGKQPVVAATEAPGCTLETPVAGAFPTEITYHNRISRIVQQHCIDCHREGGVAPFALDTYDDLVAHAGMVKQVVERGLMPPWFAAETKPENGKGEVHSPWANDRSLATAEKNDLLNWLAGGKPEGDLRDAPQPKKFEEGWLIGEPDVVFEFPNPVPIPASGVMPYQYVVVETNLAEDKWVQAIEVQPGDRSVVHHALIFVHTGDEEVSEETAGDGVNYWAIYVPGNSTQVYPEGFAKQIPKGAKLVFQMHYTPVGTATTDQTRIGLIWAKEPPDHEVRVAGIINTRISIPPGADNHREEASLRLPMDATITGFLPHMHLRGKACRYEVTRADGETTTLLDIPRYDFNWQLLYRYLDPLLLKAGDTLHFTAWFDNSEKNPANPDPTKTVTWGEQTFDEMHLGYVEYYVPGAKPGETLSLYGNRRRSRRNDGSGGNGRPRFDIEAIFKRLDRNDDGKLIGDELPAAQRDNLLRLDTDEDGAITLEEAMQLKR